MIQYPYKFESFSDPHRIIGFHEPIWMIFASLNSARLSDPNDTTINTHVLMFQIGKYWCFKSIYLRMRSYNFRNFSIFELSASMRFEWHLIYLRHKSLKTSIFYEKHWYFKTIYLRMRAYNFRNFNVVALSASWPFEWHLVYLRHKSGGLLANNSFGTPNPKPKPRRFEWHLAYLRDKSVGLLANNSFGTPNPKPKPKPNDMSSGQIFEKSISEETLIFQIDISPARL
jgi:hypothetical protein